MSNSANDINQVGAKATTEEDQHVAAENVVTYRGNNNQHQQASRNFSPTETPRNHANNTENRQTSYVLIFIILLPMILLIIYSWFNPPADTCDMSIAANRDFNKYYGLIGAKNHFTTPAADECNSNIIFGPALPPTILKPDNSASSFLTLAKYGTGKTLLRCEYYKSLDADDYLKILILNKQISEYIERFVTRKFSNQNQNCQDTNCLYEWTENEFAQLLLSTLVTEFISTFQREQITFETITIEEKIQLITIICFYYNGYGTSELEYFINKFFDKSLNSTYQADKAIVQIQERNIAQDKPLLIHFKKDLEKFSILKQDYERLHLLLAVIEGEGFQHKAIAKMMHGNVFNDLTHFSLYIKKNMNKIPVFIIDGIDENQYFFQKNSVNKDALESFCRSSVSQKIISKVMANNFYLSIFYPKIAGIDIKDAINRNDRFPTHEIEWNTKSLLNYADYVLQQMNANASVDRCEAFIDLTTLVNYSNRRIAEIINNIPTPRALHYFMIELITEMNNDANTVRRPFKATVENVQNAYEKSLQFFYKPHRIN